MPRVKASYSIGRLRPGKRIGLLLGLFALMAVMVFTTVLGENGLLHLLDLRAQQVALADRAFDSLRRNEALRQQILRIGRDDRYLETLARERLGLVGEREIVYRFPEDDEPRVSADGAR